MKTIEHGVSQDVVWSLAAGNHARQSWYGEFVNADGDNAHEWVAGDELNWFLAREGEDVRGFMRWDDDWGGADCDLNLVLVGEAANGSPANIKISTGQQNGSARAVPLEYVEYGPLTAKQEGWYSWAITNSTCATLPSWMQLFAWINDDLEHYSPSHQMGNPEESRSAGALTVGATHYQDTYAIAPYSAKGPTVDGRTKPDITGIACGLSTTIPGGPLGDGTQCWFSGTSQSAPHVAGLAALVRQRFPTYTASEV